MRASECTDGVPVSYALNTRRARCIVIVIVIALRRRPRGCIHVYVFFFNFFPLLFSIAVEFAIRRGDIIIKNRDRRGRHAKIADNKNTKKNNDNNTTGQKTSRIIIITHTHTRHYNIIYV